jgi:transcriptional regulator with XRE-family HTH domain
MEKPKTQEAITGLGQRLIEIRRQKGWTQREMATFCGVSHNSQSYYESGKTVPDARYLSQLASLGEDINSLLGEPASEKIPNVMIEAVEVVRAWARAEKILVPEKHIDELILFAYDELANGNKVQKGHLRLVWQRATNG